MGIPHIGSMVKHATAGSLQSAGIVTKLLVVGAVANTLTKLAISANNTCVNWFKGVAFNAEDTTEEIQANAETAAAAKHDKAKKATEYESELKTQLETLNGVAYEQKIAKPLIHEKVSQACEFFQKDFDFSVGGYQIGPKLQTAAKFALMLAASAFLIKVGDKFGGKVPAYLAKAEDIAATYRNWAFSYVRL